MVVSYIGQKETNVESGYLVMVPKVFERVNAVAPLAKLVNMELHNIGWALFYIWI